MALFERPWLPFVLPLFVFLLGTQLEAWVAPPPEAKAAATPESGAEEAVKAPRSLYPLVYTLKIAAVTAVLIWVWPAYRQFPWRVSPLAILVGVVGAAIWVGLCRLKLEAWLLPKLGLESLLSGGGRSAFNPLAEMADRPALAYAFLAVRFFGLAAIVPIIEEMFLRGWLMRFATRNDWWNVGFDQISRLGLALGTLVPLLMHPSSEWAAVIVWFTMITALMLYTRNLWDCVAAHAVTNLLLGIYVVATGDWKLW